MPIEISHLNRNLKNSLALITAMLAIITGCAGAPTTDIVHKSVVANSSKKEEVVNVSGRHAGIKESVDSGARTPSSFELRNYPLFEHIEASGQVLDAQTRDWMKKWRGMDLDDSSTYQFKKLSGSTSINLKIDKLDGSDPKGYKSLGAFIPKNSGADPNGETASFGLAAILGVDHIYRPTVRYELGLVASQSLKKLIDATDVKGRDRLLNRANILAEINAGHPLKGCLKAKKPDAVSEVVAMADTSARPNGGPKMSHPIFVALQATSAKPAASEKITLARGYTGSTLDLAREYSTIMTIDTIMQQWDRYSGGNIQVRKDNAGKTSFYAGDNGGGDITGSASWSLRNVGWFSRYDRQVIKKLMSLDSFLKNPATGFMGYTSAEEFVVDLGLTTDGTPAQYVERLRRNIEILLNKVNQTESQYGAAAYFD